VCDNHLRFFITNLDVAFTCSFNFDKKAFDKKECRQRDREGGLKRRFYVASLDEALYDDYLCLVALNRQQIQW